MRENWVNAFWEEKLCLSMTSNDDQKFTMISMFTMIYVKNLQPQISTGQIYFRDFQPQINIIILRCVYHRLKNYQNRQAPQMSRYQNGGEVG
jgi:hypothetical protein